MEIFLTELKHKKLKNRTFAVIDNGTWASCAGKAMRDQLAEFKDCTVIPETLTLKSALAEDNFYKQLKVLADALYTKPSNSKVKLIHNSRLILKHLCYAYKDKPVLEDISFEVFTGSLSVIAGNNGCGKSTLLSVLSGAQKALKIKDHKTEFMICSTDTEIPDTYLIHEKNGSQNFTVAAMFHRKIRFFRSSSVKENLMPRFKGKKEFRI